MASFTYYSVNSQVKDFLSALVGGGLIEREVKTIRGVTHPSKTVTLNNLHKVPQYEIR